MGGSIGHLLVDSGVISKELIFPESERSFASVAWVNFTILRGFAVVCLFLYLRIHMT